MAPARQQPAPPPFSKDEKVLCFHMDMLYEAKIMDVQPGEKPSDGYKYKVHYKGWKNTWDDWVLVDRIRPFDDEHKELAAQLHAQLKHNIQRSTKQPKKGLRSGAESARVSEERSGSATVQGGRGGRRGKDWELEQMNQGLYQALPTTAIEPQPALHKAYSAATPLHDSFIVTPRSCPNIKLPPWPGIVSADCTLPPQLLIALSYHCIHAL
ncbi:mortality factor 4-like protein 1 [Fusarium austroafricanum]|uniref:Chromatin modification-related protein EAF3 n=1 Tax=Fusarium austroafricanum TaxID=2364996 RepID=A0A8H4KNV2_9HYPO|nr:mortality factor 4-like protein 1 [Fusarium austroafricanum]